MDTFGIDNSLIILSRRNFPLFLWYTNEYLDISGISKIESDCVQKLRFIMFVYIGDQARYSSVGRAGDCRRFSTDISRSLVRIRLARLTLFFLFMLVFDMLT